MRSLALVLPLVLALCLAGCAAAPAARPAASRPLMAPATLGEERAVNQVVRAALGARELTFNCVVSVKDGVMSVTGLNAVGVRLFSVRHDGSRVQADTAAGVPAEFDPAHLVADLQLVYWPLATLQSGLREAGWQLSDATPGTRRLRRGDRLVAEVHYATDDAWTGRSWLVNFEHGYSLQVDSQPF
jgi:hypothetical protein